MAGTECAIGEEKLGLGQGKWCMDQVFGVKKMSEKYLVNGKDVIWAFMHLERHMIRLIKHGM